MMILGVSPNLAFDFRRFCQGQLAAEIGKKRTKEGLPPQKITNQANQSTKNINTKIDKGSSNANAEERARKVEESYQKARNAKAGSITAKANMVRDFDERNKKK